MPASKGNNHTKQQDLLWVNQPADACPVSTRARPDKSSINRHIQVFASANRRRRKSRLNYDKSIVGWNQSVPSTELHSSQILHEVETGDSTKDSEVSEQSYKVLLSSKHVSGFATDPFSTINPFSPFTLKAAPWLYAAIDFHLSHWAPWIFRFDSESKVAGRPLHHMAVSELVRAFLTDERHAYCLAAATAGRMHHMNQDQAMERYGKCPSREWFSYQAVRSVRQRLATLDGGGNIDALTLMNIYDLSVAECLAGNYEVSLLHMRRFGELLPQLHGDGPLEALIRAHWVGDVMSALISLSPPQIHPVSQPLDPLLFQQISDIMGESAEQLGSGFAQTLDLSKTKVSVRMQDILPQLNQWSLVARYLYLLPQEENLTRCWDEPKTRWEEVSPPKTTPSSPSQDRSTAAQMLQDQHNPPAMSSGPQAAAVQAVLSMEANQKLASWLRPRAFGLLAQLLSLTSLPTIVHTSSVGHMHGTILDCIRLAWILWFSHLTISKYSFCTKVAVLKPGRTILKRLKDALEHIQQFRNDEEVMKIPECGNLLLWVAFIGAFMTEQIEPENVWFNSQFLCIAEAEMLHSETQFVSLFSRFFYDEAEHARTLRRIISKLHLG